VPPDEQRPFAFASLDSPGGSGVNTDESRTLYDYNTWPNLRVVAMASVYLFFTIAVKWSPS
jgi:hypothetical protein